MIALAGIGAMAGTAMATDSTSIRPPNVVYKKPKLSSANHVTQAGSVKHASTTDYATKVGHAKEADKATKADRAKYCKGTKAQCKGH
jgi:hypothetical protein